MARCRPVRRRWYGPDICNRRALEFIERHKSEPFFLYYPMILVHDEHKPTRNTRPRSLFDNCDEAKENDDRRFFPDMLAYMDKLIGRVIDKLEEHGLRDNTQPKLVAMLTRLGKSPHPQPSQTLV